jgi:tetratricopeptide (TPR) repeat protein
MEILIQIGLWLIGVPSVIILLIFIIAACKVSSGHQENKPIKDDSFDENHVDKKIFNYSINTNVGKITFAINKTEKEIVQWYEKLLRNESNPNSCEKEPNENEIKLPVKDFDVKYRYGLMANDYDGNKNEIGDKIGIDHLNAKCDKYNYFVISKSDFDYIVKKQNEYIERQKKTQKIGRIFQSGHSFEKEKKIDEAIKCYEKIIALDYKQIHSYYRLLVLYRKNKDYENEKRICILIIDIHSKENEKRLQRSLSNEENKGLEDRIINAHNKNEPLFIEGRKWRKFEMEGANGRILFSDYQQPGFSSVPSCIYNPYEVSKYKDRLEKINKKIQNTNNSKHKLNIYPCGSLSLSLLYL